MKAPNLIPGGGLCLLLLVINIVMPVPNRVRAERKLYLPGRRAVVVDNRISVLRAGPDQSAAVVQRLSRGRIVGILRSLRTKAGDRFYRIAISRNGRGWILSKAVARSGNPVDAERIELMVSAIRDQYARISLARLCAEEFRRTATAPKCLLILGETADAVAQRLTADARRKMKPTGNAADPDRRSLFLNYAGLDRFSRKGLRFIYDDLQDRLIYDGQAYRELRRRYPDSVEAREAGLRLAGKG